MTRHQPEDEPMARLLRAGDPLPGTDDLEPELRTALPRTRAAVRNAAAAARAATPATKGRWAAAAGAGPVAAFIRHAAPWGTIHVAAADGGLVAIDLSAETDDFVNDLSTRLHGAIVPDGPHVPAAWSETLATAARQLDEYFAGARRSFDVPVDIEGVSPWERLVLDGARRLAYGEATSYGRLAQRIGRPRAARAVGGALGRNPIPIVIPCHRILAGDGTIGGYGGGWGRASHARMLAMKRTLLAIEGVTVRG